LGVISGASGIPRLLGVAKLQSTRAPITHTVPHLRIARAGVLDTLTTLYYLTVIFPQFLCDTFVLILHVYVIDLCWLCTVYSRLVDRVFTAASVSLLLHLSWVSFLVSHGHYGPFCHGHYEPYRINSVGMSWAVVVGFDL